MGIINKLRYTSLFSGVFLSMLAMPTAYAASVDIINDSFENRFKGWVDKEPSAVSGEAYSGDKSAKIMRAGGSIEQVVKVKQNTNYELSAYIRGSGKIGVQMYDTIHSNTGGSKKFEKVVVSFNSGEATSLTIFAHFYQSEGRFDDFFLKDKDASWF